MATRRRLVFFLSILVELFCCMASAVAQQKAQWIPGQAGLSGGILPEPGFTYTSLTIQYSAGESKGPRGESVPVTGDYSVWAIESIFSFVPNRKVLGARWMTMAIVTPANGSLTVPQFGFNAGGYGFADLWVQPITLGWSFKRADTYVGYAFMAPTGRYAAGATDNIGSGYWGHDITAGTTLYLTKKRMTTANLTTNWEIHGQKKDSTMTPGQAFTLEWGFGHIFGLDEQYTKMLQLGVVGYDQWQVTANGGTEPPGIPASLAPMYSVHAAGAQASFILPAKNLSFFFRFQPEYRARSHSRGNTVAFGVSWTLRTSQPPSQP